MEAEAFLRLVLRARHDPAGHHTLADSLAEQAWQPVSALADAERLTPLLYHALKSAPLPGDVLAHLRTVYYASARVNLLRLQYLERILQAMTAKNIGVIVLKGAALAETVYGNPALRPMADLDLLVRPRDLSAALDALQELGGQRVDAETRPGAAFMETNVTTLKLPELQQTPVELHWGLLHPPHDAAGLGDDWFWETALPFAGGPAGAWVLAPEAGLLHLCAHLCLHHKGAGLLWWNDIAELLAHSGADFHWQIVLERAKVYQLEAVLAWALPRASREFGAAVPAWLLEFLAANPPPRQQQEELRLALQAKRSPIELTARLAAASPDWKTGLRYLLRSAFPSPAYMRERYNIRLALLTPFYYPYRWLIGLIKR